VDKQFLDKTALKPINALASQKPNLNAMIAKFLSMMAILSWRRL
jgi:hypothetical protein